MYSPVEPEKRTNAKVKCDYCRQKKVKCIRSSPGTVCDKCAKDRNPCPADSPPIRRRPPDPIPEAGPPTTLIPQTADAAPHRRSLQHRLQQFEDILVITERLKAHLFDFPSLGCHLVKQQSGLRNQAILDIHGCIQDILEWNPDQATLEHVYQDVGNIESAVGLALGPSKASLLLRLIQICQDEARRPKRVRYLVEFLRSKLYVDEDDFQKSIQILHSEYDRQPKISCRGTSESKKLFNSMLDSFTFPRWLASIRLDEAFARSYQEQDLDQQDDDGRTVIHHTAELGITQLIRTEHLQRAKNLNACDIEGVWPLALAAKQSNSECLEHLLKSGAKRNVRHAPSSSEVLTVAAYYGMADNVRLLLRYGADPNDQGHLSSLRPLIAAASQNNLVVCLILITVGARLDDKYEGKNAAGTAHQNGHHELAKLLNNKPMLAQLRKAMFDRSGFPAEQSTEYYGPGDQYHIEYTRYLSEFWSAEFTPQSAELGATEVSRPLLDPSHTICGRGGSSGLGVVDTGPTAIDQCRTDDLVDTSAVSAPDVASPSCTSWSGTIRDDWEGPGATGGVQDDEGMLLGY